MDTTQQTADPGDINEIIKLEFKALQRKMRELRQIEFALHSWRKGNIGPRLLVAVLVWIFVLGLCWLLSTYMKGVFAAYNVSSFLFSLILATTAFVMVTRFSSTPRTHLEELDKLLNAYEPVSKEGYRYLQEKITKIGRMDFQLVEEWLDDERAVLEHQQILHRKPPSFVHRKV